ncbi:hypothetical protein [Nostoc sp. TCL26-01]|uniref:hypothetical protein n=1 Tax=Nostoc sp. TCL26-01 TaxID=2576904 RepID=UPI0015BA2349|nr:hypothetical protein [Nostoc sp. TCL26-01]QLE57616.1 hypothetical protein FD725_20115 [Nostoc sp. TCL26-01]
MTSRTDEIQKLIADIDSLLSSSGKRLSRLLSSQAQDPNEVLEKIRTFLVNLYESEIAENANRDLATGQNYNSSLLTKFINQDQHQSSTQLEQTQQEDSYASFQQFKNELSELIQPLQGEITALLQERTILMQEIRQLEQKRLQNYSLSQQLANQEQIITDFLQVLMNRLAPALAVQVTGTTANLPHDVHDSDRSSLNSTAPPPTFWESSEQGERLTQLTQELDQRLLSLDGTVNVIFDALQRNINTYHESLSQALARMHSTGLQGERVMADFLNNLTQYLQQQVSNLPSSIQDKENSLPSLSLSLPTIPPAPKLDPIPTPSPELVSTPPAPDNQAVTNTDELDAVLLQLGVDTPLAADEPDTPTTLFSEGWELEGDEVDLIYASLFGNDRFSHVGMAFNPESMTTDLPDLDVEDAPTTPIHPVADVDMAAMMPDAWFDQSDTGLFDLVELNSDETPITSTPSSDLWQAPLFEVETQTNLLEMAPAISTPPTNDDIIATLADLSINTDVDLAEQLIDTEKSPVTPAPQTPAVVIPHEQPEQLANNYTPASPQENLLSPEVTQLIKLPDISLNEEQWLKLHQDLAKLDEQPSSETQFAEITPEVHSQQEPEVTENHLSVVADVEVPQVASISLPQTQTVLDFTPNSENETKTAVNTPTPIQPNPEVTPQSSDSVWYLGIDLGTTGISAALLNRSTGVVYPIYWSAETQPGANSFQQSFRLPAEVYLPTTSVTPSGMEGTPGSSTPDVKSHLYSVQLKPYLQVAIPYKNQLQKWEPVLQFNELSAGPLIWVVRSLSKLLLTLKADRYSTTQGLIATAVGLNQRTFHHITSNIAGIICNCPSSWSEQYRFNVREALLTSKLVPHPGQVFFVEEAIANTLSFLDGANGEAVQLSTHKGLSPANSSDHPLIGHTLIINVGATATEMALVDIPDSLSQLTHNNFMLHSFAYASKGLEQDIICQLLLSTKYRQSRWENPEDHQKITSNPWQWQSAVPGVDRMQWQSLGWEELVLPRVGEPDIHARIRLQQRLESSLLGQAVIDAALALKLILQHQESFSLDLADQRWVLQRRDLESQVFVPFVRRLNRELNKLLVARGIPTEAINQAILTGGVANLGVVNRWLRQKLPSAKIIQDSYLGENGAPNCSRVACGLAMLPLHPQVLEESRHQYTDYFLFTELLRLLPDRTLSFNEVLQLFEARGINTSICQQRLLAFLEGELPPGLIPVTPESTWLTANSLSNADYQAIATTPLFAKQGNLSYRPNPQQLLVFHRYLDAIKASTQQSLEEPYTVNFVVRSTH